MNIKIDDKKIIFVVVLLLEIEESTEIKHISKKRYDTFLDMDKLSKNPGEAKENALQKAREKFEKVKLISSAIMPLTAKIFLD